MRTALPARAVFGCSCGRGGGLRSVMVPENAIVAGRAGPRRVRCAEWLPAMDRGCRGTGARRPECFGLIGVSHGELVPGRAALRHIHHSVELRSPPVIQEDTRRRRASTLTISCPARVGASATCERNAERSILHLIWADLGG